MLSTYNRLGFVAVNNIDKNSKLYTDLGIDSNFSLIEYTNSNSLEKTYIAKDLETKNSYLLFKTNLHKNKIEITDSYVFKLNDSNRVNLITEKRTGRIIFQKQTPEHIKNFHNNSNLTNSTYFYEMRANGGWCQRERFSCGCPSETQSECESREYDEFTSDWIGWVAYWTNPQIAILISAMCRC